MCVVRSGIIKLPKITPRHLHLRCIHYNYESVWHGSCSTSNLSPITLCCTYIPPSCSPDYFSSCISALTTIMTHHQNVIILGDFNLPDIDWSCLTSHSPFSDLLCDFIFQYNLTQLLLNSTHCKGNILDLLITNSDHWISNLHITPCSENLFSDHLFIFFDLLTNYHPPQQTFSYSLDFSKGDFDAFNDYLLEFDFSFCNSMDIDSAWNHLKSILSIGCSRYIPKIRINSHRPPKWFNSDIRHLLNRVHSLRRIYRVEVLVKQISLV